MIFSSSLVALFILKSSQRPAASAQSFARFHIFVSSEVCLSRYVFHLLVSYVNSMIFCPTTDRDEDFASEQCHDCTPPPPERSEDRQPSRHELEKRRLMRFPREAPTSRAVIVVSAMQHELDGRRAKLALGFMGGWRCVASHSRCVCSILRAVFTNWRQVRLSLC